MSPNELDLLIHGYFEQTLSPEQEETLWGCIRSDPAAADRFVELSELESGLVESLKAEDEIPSGVHAVIRGPRRRYRPLLPRERRTVWPALVAAGVLVAAVTLIILSAVQSGRKDLARVPDPPSTEAPNGSPSGGASGEERRRAEQARADWASERDRREAHLREIERRRAVLEEARKKAAVEQKPDVQRDVESQLALNETERKEEATKLEKVQEELSRSNSTEAAGLPPSRALLERVEGDVVRVGEGEKSRLEAGQGISSGHGLEIRGAKSLAWMRLEDGTRVEVSGDAYVEKIQCAGDHKSFGLLRGAALATVAKQGPRQSMTFLTPQAEVTVVGTRFLLLATPETTRVDVEEGQVRCRRLSDGVTVLIGASHYVVAGRGVPLVVRPAPVVRHFQDGLLPTPEYAGTRDTSISSGTPGANSGAAELLRVYKADEAQNAVLLRWDVSYIPPRSKVLAAEVTLWVTGGMSGPGGRMVELRRPWEESEATWRIAASGRPWQIPGALGEADRGTKVLGTLVPAAMGLSTFPLNESGVALVQQWVSAPQTNYGIAIVKEPPNAWDLLSREGAVLERRPRLSIAYAPAAK